MSDSRPQPGQTGGTGPGASAPDAATELTPGRGARLDKMPRTFGRYRIQDCLGKGGMGAVFRAHDTQLDRTVALKVPFLGDDGDETRQRFFREARAAATLHHPNICPVFDVGEEHGLPFLTMAFIEGRSLAKVIKDGPPVASAQAALLVRRLALAMQAAHDRGVVHRDLKPANVLLRPGGDPVVMDFGLARRADDRGSEGLTRRGDVIGTLEYMPPEQLDGDNDNVGPRADIYALGVLLYESLTGRRPYAGSSVQVLTAILTKPPPRPGEVRPGVPPLLEEICLKAMARDPADRYQSMTAFAAALADFIRAPGPAAGAAAPAAEVAGRAAEAPPTPRPAPSTRPIRATAADDSGEAEPPPPPKSDRRPKSSRRRKKKEKPPRSARPLAIGGAGVAVALVALGAAIALWTRDDPKVAHQTNPTPPPGTPSPPAPAPAVKPTTPAAPVAPKAGESAVPAVAKTSSPTPAPARPVAPAAPPAVALKPDAVSLAVGESREVTLDVRWNGLKGPLTVRWEVPTELRVAPAGPLTLQPGGPPPKLTVWLMAEPTGPTPALSVTATTSAEANRGDLSARLPVTLTPGPCKRIHVVADPAGPTETLALTPDGAVALVGGVEKAPPPEKGKEKAPDTFPIRVWDLRAGRPLAPLTGHTGKVTDLSVSGDGKTALSVGADDTVALWDLARGKRESQSPKQPLKVLRAAVSPDGKLALAAYPKVVLRVNLEKFQPVGQPLKTAQLFGTDPDEMVQALAVSKDRKALVGGLDGKLFLLDLSDKGRPKALTGHKEAVRAAAFAPSGGLAVTGGGGVMQLGEVRPGRENLVIAWDTAAGAPKWKAEGHAAPVVCVAADAGGKRVASGGADGEVRVWGAADGEPVAVLKGHVGRVLALAFTADGTGLVTGAADGSVREWRLP